MRKITALLLCLAMLLCLFSGCGEQSDEPHVPTGDALVMEGQDPDSVGPQKEEAPQEFSLAYYPDRGLNPLTSNDYTNRVLFSLCIKACLRSTGITGSALCCASGTRSVRI